jgi:hypothetical protein
MVAQGGVGEKRVKVPIGGEAELVQAELGGGESDRGRIIAYHSICLRAAVLEFGV